MKCTSPKSAARSKSALKRSRPEASASASLSGRPGSKKGTFPEASAAIFFSSTSTPSTSKPSTAMQMAWVAPRYPVPMTVIFGRAISVFTGGLLLLVGYSRCESALGWALDPSIDAVHVGETLAGG